MRKSISTAFFSMVSTLMVLGIVLMGCSEWVLFKNYFAKDRYETLDQVVNVAKRTAEYLVNSSIMPSLMRCSAASATPVRVSQILNIRAFT